MDISLKVVVAGPFGSGKTTFVTTASTDHALGSEHAISDSTRALKDTTTTAMDHGSAEVGGVRIGLFGTPGQDRFSFMWPILATGMHAYIVVVDASRLQARAQARGVVRAFRSFAPDVPFLVAVNRWDPDEVPPRDLAESVGVSEADLRTCDPRDAGQCAELLAQVVSLAEVRP